MKQYRLILFGVLLVNMLFATAAKADAFADLTFSSVSIIGPNSVKGTVTGSICDATKCVYLSNKTISLFLSPEVLAGQLCRSYLQSLMTSSIVLKVRVQGTVIDSIYGSTFQFNSSNDYACALTK